MSTTSDDTPKKMGKSKKVDRLDASRFQAPGINYRGKLIGIEDVPGPRGDKMCHVAMAKLKAAVKTIGEHKLKIIVNVSLDGIRIVEEKSENIIYFHPVQRISFISRDPGDSRAFGYVYGREDGLHQFYGVKTEKVAENIVLNLRDLFQIVFEMKKQEKEDLKVVCVQDVSGATCRRRSYDGKSGFEQLDVGSSPTATYSPIREAASKYDGPLTLASYSFASQNQFSDDRMSATLPSRGGFQRGVMSHASETRRSPMATNQLPLATKQYSSMTAAECRQFYYQQASLPTVYQPPSTSDDNPSPSISQPPRHHSQYSSVQSSSWFPVALPPPMPASTARRTAAHPANGLAPCSANPPPTWSSEGWAVFDSAPDPLSLSTVIEDGREADVGCFPISDESQFESDYPIYERGFSGDTPEGVNSLFPIAGVEIKKGLSPETSLAGKSPGSARVLRGLAGTGGVSTPRDVGGPSPKSPSAIPTLASPESLSDDEEEEISPDVSSFPSPNTPPPPLILDTVVDFTLRPPVPPPRPKPKDPAATRLSSESGESPIYGNLPSVHLSTQNSFTLPRSRPSESESTTIRPRPIQVGYDLTMPRPRPARNLPVPHAHDDLTLVGGQTPARHPFLRAKTLTSYADEEERYHHSESTPKNSETLGASVAPKEASQMNAACANDPFAISLGSRLTKPPSFVARSTVAMEDGLIHTSISPIPRPRPRQRSVPSASRDPSSVSPASNKPRPNLSPLSNATGSPGGARIPDPKSRSGANRSERQATGHRKTESLSCDAVAKGSERAHKWSLGSSRSDTAPDPFNHVDPFATENFSDDPFSVQPDPLTLESPSSDPFSREFPKKASPFQTRAVTVEMGDVFEDTATGVVSGGPENDEVAENNREVVEDMTEVAENKKEVAENRREIAENKTEFAENKTAGDPNALQQTRMMETKLEGVSGMSENTGVSTVEDIRFTALRIPEEDELLVGASRSCIPRNPSSAESAVVAEKSDELKSRDGKSPLNAETPRVVESQTTPSFNERRSVLWKNADHGSSVSSLEVTPPTGQNAPMGSAERRGHGVVDLEAPGSDSVVGFEDSFDPVSFCLQTDPVEFLQSKVVTTLQ